MAGRVLLAAFQLAFLLCTLTASKTHAGQCHLARTVPESGALLPIEDPFHVDVIFREDVEILFPGIAPSSQSNLTGRLLSAQSDEALQAWFHQWQVDPPRLDLLTNGSVANIVESSLFTLYDGENEFRILEGVKRVAPLTLRLTFYVPFTAAGQDAFDKSRVLHLVPGSVNPRYFGRAFRRVNASEGEVSGALCAFFLRTSAAIPSCDGQSYSCPADDDTCVDHMPPAATTGVTEADQTPQAHWNLTITSQGDVCTIQ